MAIDLFSIGPFTVHGYGLMIGLGFVLGILVGGRMAKRCGLSEDHLINIAMCVLIFGFMGGKLLYLLVNFKDFIASPLAMLGSEGFVVYGGIITGILSIYIYSRIKKLDFITYMDLLSAPVAITQGLGRVGCFMAGCCYGKPTSSHFGVVFPDGCLAPAGVSLIPTQLISAAFDLAVAIFLIIMFKKVRYSGIISGLYLMFYGVGRFIIEFFRGDVERGTLAGLPTSQFLSIFMVIFAAIYLYIHRKRAVQPEYIIQSSQNHDNT
ncbi:MAG: prolipoprotein diacylglyceryl transferase [Lachnospiraceae bacterium]|nr:prolipoprotein diacylglyceryl transferase [Lachnospiraceae bacterium]